MPVVLLPLLHRFGLLALFGAVGLESMGVPLPGETTLLLITAYAAHVHLWSPVLVFVVAALAAVIGDNAGYALGRWGGWPLLRRYGRYVRLDERRLKVARYLFDRHGGPVVAGGRFVAVLRTTAAVLAGVNQMPWRRFLAYNLAGGLAWAALWTVLGFTLGGPLGALGGVVHWGLFALLSVLTIALGVVVRRRWNGFAAAAEAAYPGPL